MILPVYTGSSKSATACACLCTGGSWSTGSRLTPYADERDVNVSAQKASQQSAAATGTARAHDDFVDLHAQVKKLLLQFLRAGNIAKATHSI